MEPRRNPQDPRPLGGIERAAVVMLALGPESATIWQRLDEDEIKVVSQAMAGLGQVTSDVVEDLLVEFVTDVAGNGTVIGSIEQTQRLLASVMSPDQVDGVMEEIRGPAGRTMWDKLGNDPRCNTRRRSSYLSLVLAAETS